MLLDNEGYSNFPQNLKMDVNITNYNIENNIISFDVNIFIIELTNDIKKEYNIEFVGYYNENTKELKVSQKCRNIFVKEFIFDGKILVKNIFQDYILPEIYKLNNK